MTLLEPRAESLPNPTKGGIPMAIRRDLFLRIEPLASYSPLAPILCARHYGRDCMFGMGHETGRLSPSEILGAALDGLVYREYLDPHFSIPKVDKLILAD